VGRSREGTSEAKGIQASGPGPLSFLVAHAVPPPPKIGSVRPVYESPLGTLYRADCLTVLPTVADESADIVFADPPFNIGHKYGTYKDSRTREDYLDWCRSWLRQSVRVLKGGGALFVFNLPSWNIELAHFIGSQPGMVFRHWITISIKTRLPIPGRLNPAHYSLLYFTKGKPRVFERPRIPIQKCRHCGRDVKDYGGHADKIHPDGLNVSDVWDDIPPVRHRSTKWHSANQLSEKMLERVLAMSSKSDDLVLDPFGGSGTTYAVAERLGRRWVGMEIGACAPIIARLRGQRARVVAKLLGDSRKGMSPPNGAMKAKPSTIKKSRARPRRAVEPRVAASKITRK